MTHLHLIESISAYGPLQNRLWIWSCLVLILIFSLVDFVTGSTNIIAYLAGVLAVASSIAIAEGLKLIWRAKVRVAQRRAKLEFNTRLGMHSPR